LFFFGLDYLGATAATCLLKEDHKVVVVNVSADKAARITVGLSPVSDPDLQAALVRSARAYILEHWTREAYFLKPQADMIAALEDSVKSVYAVSSRDGG